MALFQKGNRANPGGRPAIAKILARLKESPDHIRDEIFRKALDIVRAGPKGTQDATWWRCFEFVAAHLGLKPKDVIVHEFGEGDGADGEVDLTKLSNAELDEIIARANAAGDPEPETAPDGGDAGPAVH